MKNIFKICALVCLSAISAFAQGTLQQSDVRSTPGPVVPGATVTVCAGSVGTAQTPCFPTTTIYTDPLLTSVSVNPLTADGNGNYSFYAPAGIYVISITGQGLPGRTFTTNLPCVPSSLGCTGASLLGLNNQWTGTNTFLNGILSGSAHLPVPAGQGPFTIGDCVNVTSTAPLIFGDFGGACGGGGGGGGAFGTLSTGTNTQAAMTVGTGASIATSGSGTIAATSAPFANLTGGTNNSAATMFVGTGSSLSATSNGVVNANQINGTTVPVNLAADQAFLTSAGATGLWSSIPVCLDAAGQHLNYNTATHAFSCGTSGGTAGSAAFNTITNGTNASAAMVVGTGSSLATSGSGTIAATSAPFSGLIGTTNTSAAMVLGTGSSLTVSGSGTNNANLITGTTVPTNSAADQFLGTTASATGAWAAMPSCLDAGGNHINYNTSTHLFSCGTSGGTAGSAAFNTITPGTNSSAAMIVGTGASLAASGSGTITATALPFSGLTTSSNTTATLTMGTGSVLTTSGSGQINANFITGTTVPTNSSADQVLGTTAPATGSWLSVPNCLDSVGQHLNYNTSTHAFACGTTSSGGGGGGAGTVIASPQFSLGSFPTPGSAATIQGNNITTDGTGNNLFVPGNISIKGPNPYFDITQYGARAVTINTTGTGSGTSLTVGASTFINGDGITIAQGGAAPVIAAPTGLAVATGASGGLTTNDVPTVAGMTGATTYNYKLFAVDVLGGATVPTSPVTITNGPTALGGTPFTISTWSLTGNTLTIVTSVSSGLPVGTHAHIKATSNNALAGGWYTVNSSSGITLVFNNVPQYSATTTSGTGGTLTAFVGNALTWTRSTGGTLGTPNVVWDYYVCAQRPGDGSYHIIGRSYPSTFYQAGIGYSSTRFVDFGTVLSANPIIPWYLSDANCTAGSAQNELFTTTVSSGGGTSSLTLASGLTNAVTSVAVRQDSAPALNAVLTAAAVGGGTAGGGTAYIPLTAPNTSFAINSVVGFPQAVNIWQSGSVTLNEPVIIAGSDNWFGTTGATSVPAFGFAGTPLVTCNAWPCMWVAGFAGQGTGGTTFESLTLKSTQNGLLFLVDANWGMIWNKINFVSGQNNNDNMGIGLMIRPGASNYSIHNSNFVGGPNQVIDQTWTPLFYADQGISGCCSGGLSVGTIELFNTQWNRRGMYYLANGGGGAVIKASGRWYRQGGITPMLEVQNLAGAINGTVEMGDIFHDTEAQAAYAQICGPGCNAGAGVFAGLAFHLGNSNPTGSDAGTFPGNVTGGGNAAIQQVVAEQGPGGLGPNQSPGWMYYQGLLVATASINTNGSGQVSFVPNVATPELTLETSTFVDNITALSTSNRTQFMPDASGQVCVTGLVGCKYFVDTGAANAYVITPTNPAISALVDGMDFTIKPANANTGVSTLKVGSTSAFPIQRANTGVITNLSANDILPKYDFEVKWDATDSVWLYTSLTGNEGSGGGGGGGANTTLSNLGTTALNADLLCATAASCNLGSLAVPFNNFYFTGSLVGPSTPWSWKGLEGSCGGAQAGYDVLCIGDNATHQALESDNNGTFYPLLKGTGTFTPGDLITVTSVNPLIVQDGGALRSIDCTQFTAHSSTDGSIMLADCLSYLASSSNAAIADGHALPTATTWTENPFTAASSLPANGGVVILPGATSKTNVPIVLPQHWSLTCGIGNFMAGIVGQYGCNLQAGAGFVGTYATGTVTFASVGYHGTVTGVGTTFTSNMVGCRILTPATQPTAANSSWGVIETVSSATAATFSWSQNNGTGAAGGLGFKMDCPVVLQGNGDNGSSGAGAAQFYMQVKGIGISCNNIAGCIPLEDLFGQQGVGADTVSLKDYNNIGLDRENACQNSGPYQNMIVTGGTSATSSHIDYVSRCGPGSPMIAFNSFTSGVSAGGTGATWSMDLETSNEYIGPGHNDIESGTGSGAIIGGNISCPYVCVKPPTHAIGVVIDNLHDGAGMTTLVQVSNAIDNLSADGFSARNLYSGGTNSLVDQVNSCTDTTTRVAQYSLDTNGAIGYSTSTVAGCRDGRVLKTNFTTAGATTSDVITVTGMSSSGHCTVSPSNSTAATGLVVGTTWLDTPATNAITLHHTNTNGQIFTISCTPN